MSFDVGSNFAHHAADPSGEMARRFYVNSVDYSQHVDKWPTVKRDWNSIRSTTVAIGLENTSQLFNFFHSDKTRLKDAVDIDYGVRYRSHNLLKYSHIFSQSNWALARANLLADNVSNPVNLEVDAYKFFADTSVNTDHRIQQVVEKRLPFESEDYWLLIRAKPAEVKALNLHVNNDGGFNIYFDVESGGVVQTPGARFTDWFTRQETNGWYLCGAKITTQTSDNIVFRPRLTNPNSKSQENFTGNGSDGLYIYGAQIQEAQYSESQRYFMTGVSRQEPYGINLGQYTETLSGTNWGKSGSIFLTANNSIAPGGATTSVLAQNSQSTVGNFRYDLNFTDAEIKTADYWCASIYIRESTAAKTRLLVRIFDVNSDDYNVGHNSTYEFAANDLSTNGNFRSQSGDVSSGVSWISVGGFDSLDADWIRVWATVKNPLVHVNAIAGSYMDRVQAQFSPSVSPSSGATEFWGFSFKKGGKELLDGPGPYVAVHTAVPIYPSNAEDMIGVFDGTIRDASFSKGKLRLQAKDKLRQLSERIIGTGEVPVAINSITPSWLAFTLCSCYGGMDAVQSTNNTDIDWAAVDSWDAYNTANTVHVKADLRGIKITEALKRISRMTRAAIYLEEDRITFRRWTNVATQIETLDSDSILSTQLSVNDENLVNKQWVFGDWDEGSSYYKLALFDEDTASQNSFGLHERVIRDQSIFYVTSGAALDTAQRIVTSEAEPIDRVNVQSIPHALRMQIGESISINDPELEVAGTFRIMSQQIDMDKNKISFGVDNSQLILSNPFILDTSSLGGTDVLS